MSVRIKFFAMLVTAYAMGSMTCSDFIHFRNKFNTSYHIHYVFFERLIPRNLDYNYDTM